MTQIWQTTHDHDRGDLVYMLLGIFGVLTILVVCVSAVWNVYRGGGERTSGGNTENNPTLSLVLLGVFVLMSSVFWLGLYANHKPPPAQRGDGEKIMEDTAYRFLQDGNALRFFGFVSEYTINTPEALYVGAGLEMPLDLLPDSGNTTYIPIQDDTKAIHYHTIVGKMGVLAETSPSSDMVMDHLYDNVEYDHTRHKFPGATINHKIKAKVTQESSDGFLETDMADNLRLSVTLESEPQEFQVIETNRENNSFVVPGSLLFYLSSDDDEKQEYNIMDLTLTWGNTNDVFHVKQIIIQDETNNIELVVTEKIPSTTSQDAAFVTVTRHVSASKLRNHTTSDEVKKDIKVPLAQLSFQSLQSSDNSLGGKGGKCDTFQTRLVSTVYQNNDSAHVGLYCHHGKERIRIHAKEYTENLYKQYEFLLGGPFPLTLCTYGTTGSTTESVITWNSDNGKIVVTNVGPLHNLIPGNVVRFRESTPIGLDIYSCETNWESRQNSLYCALLQDEFSVMAVEDGSKVIFDVGSKKQQYQELFESSSGVMNFELIMENTSGSSKAIVHEINQMAHTNGAVARRFRPHVTLTFDDENLSSQTGSSLCTFQFLNNSTVEGLPLKDDSDFDEFNKTKINWEQNASYYIEVEKLESEGKTSFRCTASENIPFFEVTSPNTWTVEDNYYATGQDTNTKYLPYFDFTNYNNDTTTLKLDSNKPLRVQSSVFLESLFSLEPGNARLYSRLPHDFLPQYTESEVPALLQIPSTANNTYVPGGWHVSVRLHKELTSAIKSVVNNNRTEEEHWKIRYSFKDTDTLKLYVEDHNLHHQYIEFDAMRTFGTNTFLQNIITPGTQTQ